MVLPLLEDLKGLVSVLVFDCSHPLTNEKQPTWISTCNMQSNPDGMPGIQKDIPPLIDYDPRTGAKLNRKMVQYANGGQINQDMLKEWVLKDLPDFTIKIKNKERFDGMI